MKKKKMGNKNLMSAILVTAIAFIALAVISVNVEARLFGRELRSMNREQLREKFILNESFRSELKNILHRCAGNITEECENFRAVREEIAKGILEKVCANYSNTIEKLKKKIDSNPTLSEEEKTKLKEALDEEAKKIEELCSMDKENITIQEWAELIKEMRKLILMTRTRFELERGLIHARRIGLIIERAEHLETKLKDFIEKWKCNTTELQSLIEDFNNKIREARETYNESMTLWEQFKQSVREREPNIELLREAQIKMQLAQLKLREAHLVLKEIILKLKECRVTQKPE